MKKRLVLILCIHVSFFIGFFYALNFSTVFSTEVEREPYISKAPKNLELVTNVPTGKMPNVIPLSLTDIELIARMVYAEARGESFEGQMAVAEVILNRLNDPRFPNTVSEVLHDSGQFSPIADGSFARSTPSQQQILAVVNILTGKSVIGDALFFYNPKTSTKKNVQWFLNNTKYIITIGRHEFRGL